MNQKQIFTEYWSVLDDFEDYMNDRFRIERSDIPEFKLKTNHNVPSSPSLCSVCAHHDLSGHRSPVFGTGNKVLIINRALPKILSQQNKHFTPEEADSITKWLEAISLDLENDCKIIPMVFCPVKDPSKPGREALANCFPFINRIISETEPRAILILGKEGALMFGDKLGKGALYKNIPVFVSFHPSDVLINHSLKRPVWEVLKSLKDVVVGV
jgi:uracil-DNA glycosylase family 4